jgi:hypothetical protein
MNTQDRINNLQEAQDLIREAIDLIESALRGTDSENHADAYLIPQLKMAISDDHGYLGYNPGAISGYIQDIDSMSDGE